MKEVNSEEELDDILNSPDKTVVFYYWDMCGHCQNMHKPYGDLEKDHKDMKFVKVEAKNIPKKLGKSSFPDFEFREGNKVKGKAGGEMTKQELEKQLFGGSTGGRRRRRTRTRRLRRRVGKKSH